MNKFTKILFWLATGIGLVSLVVLIVLQVREPSQAQLGNDDFAAKTHEQSNKLEPQVRLEGVAGFDLKGISLGESFEAVKKELTCTGVTKQTYYYKHYIYLADCHGARVIFDHNEHVYSVFYRTEFSVEPNNHMIRSQLIEKYGTPNMEGHLIGNTSQIKGNHYSFCWGQCEVAEGNRLYRGNRVTKTFSGKSLVVNLSLMEQLFDDYNEYFIEFQLYDNDLDKLNSQWQQQAEKEALINQRNRESTIDF